MTRGEGRKNRTTGTFGAVDKLATGYRARYYGPDGRRHKAPTLFLTKREARAWLSLRQAEIVSKAWVPPGASRPVAPKLTLATYSEEWMSHRDLKPRTREHYRKLLDQHLLPKFGSLPLASITADDVRRWRAKMGTGTPTLRAHCYALRRAIMSTAASDGKISMNPCVIRGAGAAKRVKKIRPASLAEIEVITNAMPERYQAMVLLAAWGALRFGELTELRRRDLDLAEGVVRVERAVVRVAGGFQVGTPKSDAGVRDVALPPHLLPALQVHLDKFVPDDPNVLLFPTRHGGHLAPGTLYEAFYPAREEAGRKDLRWHDLRHSGAVLAAATGATLSELMSRLEHATPQAALKYQHTAAGRDKQIAALLSKMVTDR